ncbi:hypothetical protein DLAC_02608 [Tieghemostelium lacteum]|uniref:SH3 domain-containing protein n=1 Tax=Tieghemostelium lacteum TaxID=361077 RepID=A0A152A302_TIELA|nr:hypothetical protein DLAC_02608 [Tieghemostelium lacteum]|eukprot:KYR00589.1 hypothetical protein DLAC_02608 [Tieghemostelium lacteum]
MSYETDLLVNPNESGYDVLYKRTEGVLKCNQEMGNFFKKLSILESDYHKALVKLVKSGKKKILENTFIDGSIKESWRVTLTELEGISSQHSVFSNYTNDLSTIIEKMVKDKEVVRKKLTNDGTKLTKDMKTQLDLCTKAKVNYHKLSKEAELAQIALTKGQADPKMKQDKVSQLSSKSTQASEKANQADNEYRDILGTTNNKQNEFYNTDSPKILKEFQDFEEDRVSQTKDIMSKFAVIIKEIPPVVLKVAEQIATASEQIDKDSDIKQWVEANKTGISNPGPIEYQPYEGEGTSSNSPSNYRVGSYKAPVNSQKEWGITAKDQSLSADQKIHKLEQQFSEISLSIRSEIQAKAGIEKLIQFYASDPKEQKKAENELAEADKKISTLKEHQKVITQQLEELGKPPQSGGDQPQGNRNSNSNNLGNTLTGAGTGNSNQSTPTTSGPNTGAPTTAIKLVKVRGLYDYEAGCDTELSFHEGDILTVTEQDSSGWWFAELNGASGFVPQNYVEQIKD